MIGKIQPQVGALACEHGMRRDRDRYQEIADATAGAGQPLPLQADGLAIVQSGRDLYVDLLAGRKLHAFASPRRGLAQRDGQRGGDVLTATGSG